MKKSVFILIIFLFFIIPSIFALNLQVEKKSSNEEMVLGMKSPTIFKLNIKNNGPSSNFKIYTIFGSGYSPKESFKISSKETKEIDFEVIPPYESPKIGEVLFEYYIKDLSNEKDEFKGILSTKVWKLENALNIGANDIDTKNNKIKIYIKNRANYNFKKLDVDFSSIFFDGSESFSLGPHETKIFEISLNEEDTKKLTAGFYTIEAIVNAEGNSAKITGKINFAENKDIDEELRKTGFVVSTITVTKSNKGNVPETVEIKISKNIISRIFTSFNLQPNSVSRKGFLIDYSWIEELSPGEKLEIKARTNWLLPLILLFFIVIITIFFREIMKSTLTIKKRVNFVKSKGGEFALKISLLIHAKKHVDNVLLVDSIPTILKLYPHFDRGEGSKFNENLKRIEWNFNKLNAGEKRIVSYVVYSKVGVLGKFALPRAKAVYDIGGKIYESNSNQTYFLSEQKTG